MLCFSPANCDTQAKVKWKLPILPIEISYDINPGNISVGISGELVTPLGTFGAEVTADVVRHEVIPRIIHVQDERALIVITGDKKDVYKIKRDYVYGVSSGSAAVISDVILDSEGNLLIYISDLEKIRQRLSSKSYMYELETQLGYPLVPLGENLILDHVPILLSLYAKYHGKIITSKDPWGHGSSFSLEQPPFESTQIAFIWNTNSSLSRFYIRGECATIVLKTASFQQDEAEKLVCITATNQTTGNDCHACAAAIGFSVLEVKNGKLSTVSDVKYFDRWGNWGHVDSSNASIIKIGPARYGVLLKGSGMGMGYQISHTTLYEFSDANISEIFNIRTEYTYSGVEGVPFSENTEMEFVPGRNPNYYDIRVIKINVKNNGPGAIRKVETLKYVYSGRAYKQEE